MTKEQLQIKLNLLDNLRLALFFAVLSNRLTIAARDTYGDDGMSVKDSIRLRDFNEILHRITVATRYAICGDKISDAISMVIGYYVECPNNTHESHINEAYEYALRMIK